MKVVVFGSTGQTGQQLVEQLVQAGHTVTAFARTPGNVNTYDGKVTVVQGDAKDLSSIQKAVKGQDAVFHALAQHYVKKDDVQTVFATNLVQAMLEAKVNRLIVLSAWGSGDSAAQAKLFMKILRYTFLRNVFQDKANAEQIITTSTLNYTLVRPGMLLNGPKQGGVTAKLIKGHLKVPIRRSDVAAFMIAQLDSKEWERKSPLIGH
jgi:uncharacterized protein YbjT (DUF2867 family)